MSLTLKMALRSLARHKKRTSVNCILIFLSTLVVFFAFSFCRTVNDNMREAVVGCATANIQLHDKTQPDIDIYSTPPAETVIFEAAQEMLEELKKVGGVMAVSERLRLQGLFTFDGKSTSSVLTGIIPVMEEKILTGIKITEGNKVTKKNGIIIGEALKEKLKAQVGDTIKYAITDAQGSMIQTEFEVEGVFFADGLDMYMGTYAFCDLNYLREELNYESSEVTEVVVRIERSGKEKEVLESIEASVDLEKYRVKAYAWNDVAETYSSVIQTSTIIPGIVSVSVSIVVVLGLINNIITNFMERKKENGILSALGTSRARLIWNYGNEYVLVGAITSGITLLLSAIAIIIIGHIGISTETEILTYIFGGRTLHLRLFWDVVAITFFLFSLVPSVVALVVSVWGTKKIDLTHLS